MPNEEDFEILDGDEANTSPSNHNNTVSQKINDAVTKHRNEQKPATGGINNGNQFKNSGNLSKISGAVNSNNPEEQAQNLKNLGKEAIKPMVRKGVQAATGGAIGTDPVTGKIIDKVVDKVADNPQVDKIIEDVTKKTKKARMKILLPILGSVISILLPIILIIVVISKPVGVVNEFVHNIRNTGVMIGDYLFGNGFCTWSNSCKESYEEMYYEIVNNYATEYSKAGCGEMDIDLINATVFYQQMMLNESSDVSQIDYAGAYIDFINLSSRLYPNFFAYTEEVENILDRFVFANGVEKFKELLSYINVLSAAIRDNFTDSNTKCMAKYESYKRYLDDHYIKDNYKKLQNSSKVYDNNYIILDLMSFSNYYNYQGIYTSGEAIIGAGLAGAIPDNILSISQSPLNLQSVNQTSCFGYYDYDCGGHNGVDLTGAKDILSIADGVVHSLSTGHSQCAAKKGDDGRYSCPGCLNSAGNNVTIKHTVNVDGKDVVFYSRYLHLKSVYVTKAGEEVLKGDIIGEMGTTGCSTGTHLHFDILDESKRTFNPEELFNYLNIPLKNSINCNDLRLHCSNKGK